ncbi:MAG TPA: hemolysin family protein [Gemmatimonadales bacterium]|jgi:CBS domain containing-hemolysin-like protein|nr:hemolysin family protein [Gemmatimonadales bacterium]
MDEPGGNSLVWRLAALVVLLAINAFFVAAEFALVAARRTRIESMIQSGDRKAKVVLRALNDLNRQLSAAQFGITVASILLGYVAEETATKVLHGWFSALPAGLNFLARGGVASVIAVTVVSFLHVVFGEQAPKTWAIAYPETTSRWAAGPLLFFSWITRPATGLLNWCTVRLVRLMGVKQAKVEHERIHSPEEIMMLVEQSQEGGGLAQEDARLIEGVFEFTEKVAQDVMTPRTQMAAVESDMTVAQAADAVAEARRSRYPVYTESIDEIVGVVHAKDILIALRRDPNLKVSAVMRTPFFVPGTREVEDVLADMKRLKVHLAVVLDEYGGTAGLVTMEDLLEEIVGDIFDEYDRPDAESPAQEGAPIIDGSMPISEFNTQFDLDLDDAEYTTVGGYLFGELGRLPRPGDRVTLKGHVFEILEMEGRRVKKVRVLKSQPQVIASTPVTAGKSK